MQDLSPRLRGLGWVCFVSTCGIVIYYNVVLAWCTFVFSFLCYNVQCHVAAYANPKADSAAARADEETARGARGEGQVPTVFPGELRGTIARRHALAERSLVAVFSGAGAAPHTQIDAESVISV